MDAVVDTMGRIVVPKALRERLGLTPGTRVDISAYGTGIQIVPAGRTARLIRDAEGRLVATGHTTIDDDTVFTLIDAGRR